MYTGTLIDQLMDTVERAEARTDRRSLDTRSQEERLAYWYAVAQQEVAQFESSLAGGGIMAAAQCAAPTMRRKRTWTGTPEGLFCQAHR